MPQARSFSSKVPWRAPLPDGVVLCKHRHALLRVYTIRGLDMIGDDPETIGARMLLANQALKRLSGGWTVHAEAQRLPFQRYPRRAARFVIPGLIDQERARVLCHPETGLWETRYFLALTWEPPQGQKRAHALFVQTTAQVMGHLQPVLADMRLLQGEELLSVLKTTVSLRWNLVAWPTQGTALARYLVDSAWQPGRYPDWDARLGTQHVRVLTLTGYPRRSWAGMMQKLEALALPYRWATRWQGIQPYHQDALLTERQKDWLEREKTVKQRVHEKASGKEARVISEDATRKAEDLSAARQDVGAGLYGIGTFSTTIVTWADTADEAEGQAIRIRHTLEGLGFVVRREGDYGARTPMGNWVLQYMAPPHHAAAFRGAMPGNTTDNLRRTIQSTLAVTHLLPGLRALWPGPERDDHLKQGPWFLAQTDESSLVRIVQNVRDVGHQMLLGNTGSGKSTMVGFGMAQWLMYDNTQGTIFDVGRTARLLTLLCGGEWIDFVTNATESQPLRYVDEPAELRWGIQWLLGMCARAKVEVNSVTQEYIKERLEELARLHPDERTMTRLLHICALHSNRIEARVTSGVGTRDASGMSRPNEYRMERLELHRAVQRALRPFAKGGQYGGILDGVQDHVLDSHLVVFEQMHLLKDMPLLEAVSQYCFHLTELRFDTRRPMWLVLEEAPLLAVMPTYKEQFDAWLMTIRKAGANLALVVNSLEQAAQLGLGLLTSENTPTRWYFPNVEAVTPQTGKVYDLFGLTQAEKLLIATAKPYRDIYYVARERGRRMMQLPLSPFILDCIARNTDEDHELMDTLLAQEGKEGFARAWFAYHGYTEAAGAVERGKYVQNHNGSAVPVRTHAGV